MKSVFVDTSFLVAEHNARDLHRAIAIQTMKELTSNEPLVSFVITDYIFDEFVTFTMVKLSKSFAETIGQHILDDKRITILHIDHSRFRLAWEIFKRKKDKLWSFTDCTSFVVIQELNLQTALSFDRHFKQFGIEVLPQ